MNVLKKTICVFWIFLAHSISAYLPGEFEMQFVPIPAGEFVMGSPLDEAHRQEDEGPGAVRLTRSFEMQATEVTQLHWFKVMGANPSRFKKEQHCPGEYRIIGKTELCPHHPVERVAWDEVQDFIAKLNQYKNDGYTYRLPTEAEWEYAARAGAESAYFFADDGADLVAHAWYRDNSNRATHNVGQKRPNFWGLYDMYGNASEWVQDYYAAELPGGADPVVDGVGILIQRWWQGLELHRTVRGGSWSTKAELLRSANRDIGVPGSGFGSVGFRLARIPRSD